MKFPVCNPATGEWFPLDAADFASPEDAVAAASNLAAGGTAATADAAPVVTPATDDTEGKMIKKTANAGASDIDSDESDGPPEDPVA